MQPQPAPTTSLIPVRVERAVSAHRRALIAHKASILRLEPVVDKLDAIYQVRSRNHRIEYEIKNQNRSSYYRTLVEDGIERLKFLRPNREYLSDVKRQTESHRRSLRALSLAEGDVVYLSPGDTAEIARIESGSVEKQLLDHDAMLLRVAEGDVPAPLPFPWEVEVAVEPQFTIPKRSAWQTLFNWGR